MMTQNELARRRRVMHRRIRVVLAQRLSHPPPPSHHPPARSQASQRGVSDQIPDQQPRRRARPLADQDRQDRRRSAEPAPEH